MAGEWLKGIRWSDLGLGSIVVTGIYVFNDFSEEFIFILNGSYAGGDAEPFGPVIKLDRNLVLTDTDYGNIMQLPVNDRISAPGAITRGGSQSFSIAGRGTGVNSAKYVILDINVYYDAVGYGFPMWFPDSGGAVNPIQGLCLFQNFYYLTNGGSTVFRMSWRQGKPATPSTWVGLGTSLFDIVHDGLRHLYIADKAAGIVRKVDTTQGIAVGLAHTAPAILHLENQKLYVGLGNASTLVKQDIPSLDAALWLQTNAGFVKGLFVECHVAPDPPPVSTKKPTLRQRQRDDKYRVRGGGRNAPTSRQKSIRAGWKNTYS